ncbi:PHP domain-containing protein [Candidatus Omnitrophus magneticus]|uniref:PHP domain-containing protein n=1 Tax=Candidatus Omnitrophus magneticus TaxID=1609969 RepID=A0A0F0CRH2_9BACT|nr:PHP domain-containing protein [Candidatus Omnitrophus magneticus]
MKPGRLIRRSQVGGVTAIAVTDHVDHSNISYVIEGLTRVAGEINRYWNIRVIPGVEITHVPLECFKDLVSFARLKGVEIVVAHGESPVEPVIKGTNRVAIEAGVDILAHPGHLLEEDAILARDRGVYLEITARSGHSATNAHVFSIAEKTHAKLVFNTDAHTPADLLTKESREKILNELRANEKQKIEIIKNAEEFLNKIAVARSRFL